MMTPEDFRNCLYHDFLIEAVRHEGSVVTLELAYYEEDDTEARARAIISGVETVLREGILVERFAMEAEYAGILSLEQEGAAVVLVAQWKTVPPRHDLYGAYKFIGRDVQLRGERG